MKTPTVPAGLVLALLLGGAAVAGTARIADEPPLSEAQAIARLARSGARFNPDDAGREQERPVRGVGFFGRHRQIADEDLMPLRHLPSLEYVYILSQGRVNGSGLRHLAHAKSLRTLDLRGTPIQSRHLIHLRDMPQLHKLGLWHTGVNDEGMAHLKGLVNLEHLYLDGTRVGDTGVAALGANPSLCNVTWAGSRVTGKGEAIMKQNFPRLGRPPMRGD